MINTFLYLKLNEVNELIKIVYTKIIEYNFNEITKYVTKLI